MRGSKSDNLLAIRLLWVKDQRAVPSRALLLASKVPHPNIIEVRGLRCCQSCAVRNITIHDVAANDTIFKDLLQEYTFPLRTATLCNA
jgi:hypothetical protein